MILLVSVAMAVVSRHVFYLAKRLLSEFSVALVIPLDIALSDVRYLTFV